MKDWEVVEEILLIGDYMDDVDEVLSRDTQKFSGEGQKIIELDLSGLDLDELSPTIGELDQLRVLDIRNNNIAYLPPELGELPNLERIFVVNNPLRSIPPLPERVKVDKTLPYYDIRVEMKKRRTPRGILLPEKVCTWCNKAAGYRKEVQRTDSKWGFTTHVSTILVCLNCSYMHQFYSARSMFDFE